MGVGLDGIVACAAAAEVIGLEIARGFVEAELVEFIVHPVAPIEELGDGGVAVIAGGEGEVEREIEDAGVETGALGAGGIGDIIGIEIEMGVDIIADGFGDPVVDPAVGGGGGIEGGEGDERAGDFGGLGGGRSGVAWLEGGGAVAGEDAISGLADVIGKTVAEIGLAGGGIDEDAEHFVGGAACEGDIPAEAGLIFIEGEPGEASGGAAEIGGGEALFFFGAEWGSGWGEGGVGGDFADILGGDGDGVGGGDRGVGEEGEAIGVAAIGGGEGIWEEVATEVDEFALFGGVGLEDGVENGDAIDLLLPDLGAQAVVAVGVIAF